MQQIDSEKRQTSEQLAQVTAERASLEQQLEMRGMEITSLQQEVAQLKEFNDELVARVQATQVRGLAVGTLTGASVQEAPLYAM